MAKTFEPPFVIEALFYDAQGEELEWAEHWGPCPQAVLVIFRIYDSKDRVYSTYNTREKAETALAKLK